MRNYDSVQHVKGESQYVDDIMTPAGTLHGYVVYSQVAHGVIKSIDISKALAMPGVHAVLTAKDIPGENQIGGIVKDEELFASHHVHFVGNPVGMVIAESKFIAHKAAKEVILEIEPLPAVFDPREAYKKGDLIIPPKVFTLGDISKAFAECDIIIEGRAESGGQEHLYLETQAAFAVPVEGGGVKVISSTQSPTAVQKTVAQVLALPMNRVEVDVVRLGGGFGGKEDQATAWAVMAALGAKVLKKPVKLILPRQEDMRMTGKRHPYSSDYKIGLKKDGTILAYEATFYQNSGATADLSPAILERTLFHCTNSYYVPNVKAIAYSCKTNLPPNTAFRGFGGPQGMFAFEAALYKAAEVMKVDPIYLQKKNLIKEGDEFSYGQRAKFMYLDRCYAEAEERYNLTGIKSGVDEFNKNNKLVKKGVYVMPICFGISFTTTFLNQASALVHIYTDGSINVSTAAVEMGQGVNAKIIRIASTIFSVNPERIRVDTTNTSRVANTSATAASKGADLNGFATQAACEIIVKRLQSAAADMLGKNEPGKISFIDEIVYYDNVQTAITWEQLIWATYVKRISLSAQAHHATPEIYFDKETSKGLAFAYHATGVAIVEVTVDCLRGIYDIDSLKIVHDIGKSLHPMVDLGQVEGAAAQGIGWMTMEEVIYNDKGKLITDALSTYKIPDIYSAPKDIQVHFLENADNPFGPFKSKAVGEPPLMYGIGAYFAILNAIKEVKKDISFDIIAPMTPERVMMYLHKD
jgi:xanthine dehydrogenase large subunit